ncbi:nucleoporin Nup43 [Diabrotica virgifera virgifera]|uniref:Nucleoporin Nup43 n=1 Tax=Diabrotica virgifera virgifera TaxID=50390 RepID=A0A6P7FGF8_DIAVI|nr:nucleoporin Nup43 [Diabrotica virgifera virgifera]
MSHSLHGTFVSEKINKIRWRPDEFNNCHFFVTGSVDNVQNNIKLWDFCENIEEDDVYPFLVFNEPYCGDVTEIEFLNADYFVTSSSSGSAHLKKIIPSYTESTTLKNEVSWSKIHEFKNGDESPCTSLTTYENDIVTVGEDGTINLLNAKSPKVVRKIDNADSCSIHCVIFLKHNEVLTSNLRGQMKIWDLRSTDGKPNSTFMISGEQVTPTCLTFHPTQRHLVITGDDLGSLTTWDLRHNTYPVNVLNAHEGAVSEIKFNPECPDQLFTCSSSGEIWHWTTKATAVPSLLLDTTEANVWLAPDNVKNKLDVFTLMPTLGKPINSLDLNRNKVICGCDNEAIYLINGVNL